MLEHLVMDAAEEAARRGIVPVKDFWCGDNEACLVGVLHLTSHEWDLEEETACRRMLGYNVTECTVIHAKFNTTEGELSSLSFSFTSNGKGWSNIETVIRSS